MSGEVIAILPSFFVTGHTEPEVIVNCAMRTMSKGNGWNNSFGEPQMNADERRSASGVSAFIGVTPSGGASRGVHLRLGERSKIRDFLLSFGSRKLLAKLLTTNLYELKTNSVSSFRGKDQADDGDGGEDEAMRNLNQMGDDCDNQQFAY